MAEVLVQYSNPVTADDGTIYVARACGGEADNGHWHGWLEFVEQETGAAIRSGRETTQPNRTDTVYWATGLTHVYLEGALARARHPLVRAHPQPLSAPHFSEPAPAMVDESAPPPESILDPFSVYRKGEALLRRQLGALSAWHLVNIVRAHALSEQSSSALNRMTGGELIELIVRAVQLRTGMPLSG